MTKIAAILARVDDKSEIKVVISNSSGSGFTGTKIESPGYTLFVLPRKH